MLLLLWIIALIVIALVFGLDVVLDYFLVTVCLTLVFVGFAFWPNITNFVSKLGA